VKIYQIVHTTNAAAIIVHPPYATPAADPSRFASDPIGARHPRSAVRGTSPGARGFSDQLPIGDNKGDDTVNTANLQLAGLCLALDGLCRALIKSGALPREAIVDALAEAEAAALSEPRDLSDAHRDAMCFPIRALRAGLDNPVGISQFAALATQVGRDKPQRHAPESEPGDTIAAADHLTDDEHLLAARTIEAERDA
jgi:hypothetical protein